MAKIYIDCGAWTGDSIIAFKEKFPNSNEFDIYAFECHPDHFDQLTSLSKKENFKFFNKAVWVNYEQIKLFLGVNDLTQSSSLYSEKKKFIDKDKYSVVDAVDFSDWLYNNFSASDTIICKMNIEGAEYDVLDKMISDETIYLIDKLYIAWHYTKIKDFPAKRHTKLVKTLKNLIEIAEWDYDDERKNPF